MKLTIAKDELQFGHKQTLNKDFWKDEKLDAEVRLAIMAIVKNFLKTTNLEMTADEIDEIEFTGSLANYNYGKYSDVDIHLLFDFSKIGDDPEFMRDYLTTKAINWNNRHNVTIFGHEVELYITDAGSDHHSTGVYSVKDDKWLVKPVRDTKLSAELNLNKVKDKADKISKEIDMLVSVEGDLSLETIEGLKNKIKKMRVAGLETGGEFSIENLAFKLLRRRGELNTLYALMNQAQDAELSLDEDVEWWKNRRKKDNKNYRELMGFGKKKSVFKKKYAFKNVGKKNKLNRMIGAPYMMDPPMKLPKSGPPGVGALEEETDLVEVKIPDDFKNAFLSIQSATMNFQVLEKIRYFGFTAFDPNKTYKGTISGNNINFPNSEKGNQTLTKQDFIETLEGKDKPFCGLLNCKTSTIKVGQNTQTLEKFITTLGGAKSTKPRVKQSKKPIEKVAKDTGVKQILGSGTVYRQKRDRIIANILSGLKTNDKFKIFFRDIFDPASDRFCLKKHSYTITTSATRKRAVDFVTTTAAAEPTLFAVKLDQPSYESIYHPDTKITGTKMQLFDPTGCLFTEEESFTLNVTELINWINGQLKSGTIYKIEKPGLTYVGTEYVAPPRKIKIPKRKREVPKEKATVRSSLSVKIKSEKRTVSLYLVPKKDIYFFNSDKLKLPTMTELLAALSNPSKLAEKFYASIKDVVLNGVLYYRKGSTIAVWLYPKINSVKSKRDIPSGGLLDEIKKEIIKAILDQLRGAIPDTPRLPGLPSAEDVLKKIEKALQKINISKVLRDSKIGTVENFSTIDVYLSKLEAEYGDDVCSAFDCRKSLIIKKWPSNKVKNVKYRGFERFGPRVGSMSFVNYLGIKASQLDDAEEAEGDGSYLDIARSQLEIFENGKLKEWMPDSWAHIAKYWRVGARASNLAVRTLNGIEYGFPWAIQSQKEKNLFKDRGQGPLPEKYYKGNEYWTLYKKFLEDNKTKDGFTKFDTTEKINAHVDGLKQEYDGGNKGKSMVAYWSAAFINYCMRNDEDWKVLTRGRPKGSHKGYGVVTKRNQTLLKNLARQGKPWEEAKTQLKNSGMWTWVDLEDAKEIGSKTSAGYPGLVGDIVMSKLGDEGYHGDIRTADDVIIGGNLSNSVKNRMRGTRIAIVTKNLSQLKKYYEKLMGNTTA